MVAAAPHSNRRTSLLHQNSHSPAAGASSLLVPQLVGALGPGQCASALSRLSRQVSPGHLSGCFCLLRSRRSHVRVLRSPPHTTVLPSRCYPPLHSFLFFRGNPIYHHHHCRYGSNPLSTPLACAKRPKLWSRTSNLYPTSSRKSSLTLGNGYIDCKRSQHPNGWTGHVCLCHSASSSKCC